MLSHILKVHLKEELMQENLDDALSTIDENSGKTVKAADLMTPSTETRSDVFDAASYNAIKSLIQTHLDKLDAAKAKQKEFKDMLNDVLTNDNIYQEEAKKAEDATKAKNQTKQQLLKDPKIAALVEKAREFGLEVKEAKVALSEYLLQYQQIAGVNEIEDSNGESREIVLSAKIK